MDIYQTVADPIIPCNSRGEHLFMLIVTAFCSVFFFFVVACILLNMSDNRITAMYEQIK